MQLPAGSLRDRAQHACRCAVKTPETQRKVPRKSSGKELKWHHNKQISSGLAFLADNHTEL